MSHVHKPCMMCPGCMAASVHTPRTASTLNRPSIDVPHGRAYPSALQVQLSSRRAINEHWVIWVMGSARERWSKKKEPRGVLIRIQLACSHQTTLRIYNIYIYLYCCDQLLTGFQCGSHSTTPIACHCILPTCHQRALLSALLSSWPESTSCSPERAVERLSFLPFHVQ